MSSNLARIQPSGPRELSTIQPIDEVRPLDKYAGGLATEPVRIPWLATISAGYKTEAGYPQAARKKDAHWIHMTDDDRERAPGLWAAIEKGDFKWLDVAVASDDPAYFLQQRFEKRSATRLEAYGDENEIVELKAQYTGQGNNRTIAGVERIPHPAGSIEYKRLVAECNVAVNFFFTLARWEGQTPRIYFPPTDGLGVYRLRFTSRNSLRELLASLRQISELTGGRFAGLPLRLGLDWRQVADPAGTRREICVWTLRFMPPQGIDLTPSLWQDLKQKALAEGALLRAVPPPTNEVLEDAAVTVDADLDEPDPRALEALRVGPPCDAEFYQKAWFARVKGSRLDSDEARAGFIEGFTGRRTDSLAEFLRTATEEEAARLIAAAGQFVGSESTRRNARRYEEIFGDDDQVRSTPPPPGVEATSTESEPTHAQKRARLEQLIKDARRHGLTADAPLAQPGEDPLDAAIAYWERRIADVQLDKQLAAEQGQIAF